MQRHARSSLQLARARKGWTQKDLARRIGAHPKEIGRWERGQHLPTPYYIQKLAEALGMPARDLGFSPSSQFVIHDPLLPARPLLLVGRENELLSLKQQLLSTGMAVLGGLPGVGKTALSLALAHDQQIRRHFRDGVLWVSLGPDPNLPAHFSRWGRLLGLSDTQMADLSSSQEWARVLRTAIGSRSMLLVIDDVWNIEDALTLKIGGPTCAHLLTTRSPRIAVQAIPERAITKGAITIHELSEEESIDLLCQMAPQILEEDENVRRIYPRIAQRVVTGSPSA